jgi:hypothetical protein
MDGMDSYLPGRPAWRKIWKQLPLGSRKRRFAAATKREELLKILAGREPGESERESARTVRAAAPRTSLRRWQQRHTKYGFDGLVDWRMPPEPPSMTPQVRIAICTLRRADPNVSVAVIVDHIAQYHHAKTCETMVKRVLREEGLARRPGPADGTGSAGEQRLELGGMKLVEAALEETGYLRALSVAVSEQLAAVPIPESGVPVDRSDRDEWGRFLPSYNERYRKNEGDAIGPGFASVETNRVGMDPARLHVGKARQEIIERKMLGLMTSPLLGGGRWDGIRAARGALLEELCGFGYMPSTLDLFSRELKYVGVSSTMWEAHARLWLTQTAKWGSERNAVVLFIDETNKPVWTDLFSQSSKVSSVGRVMPSLESVYFHSGYGVPLWMVSHSGRMPLVKAVPGMLSQFRQINDGAEIGRIVVLDAETNSVPFFKVLEQGPPARAWVTRFRPSLLAGKRIFNRTNYRAYRNGDRVRMGVVDLNDPESKQGFLRVRVVEVERRSKGTVTYLGASTLLEERDWDATQIADLYFERWPNQEANFRAVNQALGLKEVHGYGKQLVDNVSVVTELDELNNKSRRREKQIEQDTAELEQQLAEQREHHKLLTRLEKLDETLTHQVQTRLGTGLRITPKLRQLALEQTSAAQESNKQALAVARCDKKTEQLNAQLERQKEQLNQYQARQATLESRRRIFRHDVELDSIFSVLKVGLVLAITFVLKEYLGGACMQPVTFLERVATLPARLRVLPKLEILTFEYNPRDPDVMALLAEHSESINARALRTRSGRTLRVQVDPAPPPTRPPTGRAKTMDRFHPK